MLQVNEASPADRVVNPVRQWTSPGNAMHGPAKANTRPFNVKIHRDSVYLPNGVVDISATHGSVALIGRGAINNSFWAASCCLWAGDRAGVAGNDPERPLDLRQSGR